MTLNPKEKRSSIRYQIALGGKVGVVDMNDVLAADSYFIGNISESGMFIEQLTSFKIGQQFQILISLDTAEMRGLYMVDVQVVHVKWNHRQGVKGTGVKFIKLDQEDVDIIDTYVEFIREKQIRYVLDNLNMPNLEHYLDDY